MKKEIIYVGDPMCSWCYGFSPVIQELYDTHKDAADMSIVVGGLRVGDEHVVDDARLKFLKEHWVDIGERTGQAFALDILEKTGWIYNTEWACRAVVAMRKIKPEETFRFFAAVQANFYANNLDPAAPETYAGEAEKFGVEKEAFLEVYEADETKQETMRDFTWSQQHGITGFPTVLVKEGEKLGALTLGYQPIESLREPVAYWIENGFPEQGAAE